jgi:hypothetical protein
VPTLEIVFVDASLEESIVLNLERATLARLSGKIASTSATSPIVAL